MNSNHIDEKTLAEHEKIKAEIAKLMAETSKLNAEFAKLSKETSYYPIVITATATLALVAVVKLFL